MNDLASTLVTLAGILSIPVRWRILLVLTEGEHSVNQLAQVTGRSQPMISFHLKQLRDGGLVERSAVGRYRLYGLTNPELGAALLRTVDEYQSAMATAAGRDAA